MEFSKQESMIKECFLSADKSPLNLPIICQNYLVQHGKKASYAGPSYWQGTRPSIVYQAKKPAVSVFITPLRRGACASIYARLDTDHANYLCRCKRTAN